MEEDPFKQVHYYLDPRSDGLEDLLGLGQKFSTHKWWGGGGVAVQDAGENQPRASRSLTLSMVEPDLDDEADAHETLSGDALASWQRSAPRRALSNALKNMRCENNLSQEQVAKKMGVTQSDIARMESSAGPWPNQAKLAAYAHACGMKAVLGFIDADENKEESAIKIVSLGGTFGDNPEEVISAEEFLSAEKRKTKFYE